MRDIILKKLAGWHAYHPGRMLLVVVLATVILAGFASRLTVTMRTSDLLPEGDERVVQFNKIIDEFATATSLVVVVQGEEERIKDFADKLAPRLLTLRYTSKNESFQKQIDRLWAKIERLRTQENKESEIAGLQSEITTLQAEIDRKLFQRIDYKAETDFLRNHGLMLVKAEDLKNTKDVFTNPNLTGLLSNINNSMEKEYVGQDESISTRENEDGAVMFLDGIQNLVLKLQKAARGEDVSESEAQAAADKLLLGEPYLLSYDKKALILNAIPTFTIMDRDLLMSAAENAQAVVDALLRDFPDVKAGLSGGIAREHDEQVYSSKALGSTTVVAMIAILLLLMVSFKMWAAPMLAVANLVVGLIWAVGAAAIMVGQLNMATSTMSVILLGLGVDFSIHLISGFTEWRAAGDSIAIALEKTFLKNGKGIITGALTTACAFLALIISQSRGMKEMGIVTGAGLLSILLATMLFLPVLLVYRERRIDRRREKSGQQVVQQDISFRFLGRVGGLLSKHYVYTICASGVVSALLVWSASKITFDHNYMNMEPKGLTSIALMDTVLEKFDLSMEYAFILADDVAESRELSEKARDLGPVAVTDDISVYLPSPQQQQQRIPLIHEVREQVQSIPVKQSVLPSDVETLSREIDRLQMNIMEIQDMAFLGGRDKVDNKCNQLVGDPEKPGSGNIIPELLQLLDEDVPTVATGLSGFQRSFAPYFRASVVRMTSTEPIRLDELPASILDRYSNRTRDKFLVTVFPQGNLWEHTETLNRFVDDLERVSDKATGTPSVFLALIRIFGRDGRNAIMLTLVIVVLLLWLDFRNLRHTLMAMIPLALGVFWMVGLMYLTGMQLTFMNVMAFPMIIGIGIDDGVHIIHRWRHEGKHKVRHIFSSTGKAILLTSLTTIFAFGSLIFSVFPGWGQFGAAMSLGVAACFLTTVLILPGIIGISERPSRRTRQK